MYHAACKAEFFNHSIGRTHSWPFPIFCKNRFSKSWLYSGMFDWFVMLSVTKQLKLSEECRADRSLWHTIIGFFGQREEHETAADCTHDYIGQPSNPQIKLSSVLRLLLILLCRRSKRVGLVLSCVWFSSELGCSENADSSSWEYTVLCGRIGFLSEGSPHAIHDYGSYWARLNTSSIVLLLLMLPPHPADRACVVVCMAFKPSCWFWNCFDLLWNFGVCWVE